MSANDELKPCPFCGYPKSRLMHRSEYRRNAEGLKACYYEPDVGMGLGGREVEIDMFDFRHVFYRRCNKCGARSKPVKTDWHVRTEDEASDFSPYESLKDKQCGFDADSEWAEPWRDEANARWNTRSKAVEE